ncbi:MAG: DMT family transporter [Bacteroidales bacterium]|nr:DMT family transporter [Bacteroidales bacterium]
MFWGEFFAVGVVLMWAGSAICFDYVNQFFSSIHANIIRFLFGFLWITLLLWMISGRFFFSGASTEALWWLCGAGVVGLVFGDYFLFAAYRLIHASYTQLLMTLSPLFAAVTSFFLLHEALSLRVLLGMMVTLGGIALTIVKKNFATASDRSRLKIAISGKGIFFAILSALGQGVGLVLSKKGMQAYHISAGPETTVFYISIAATQIRIIVGFICFFLMTLCMKGGMVHFFHSVQNPKVVAVTGLGALFGLGIGVPLSLLALQYAQAAVVSTIIATVPMAILIYRRFFHHQHISWEEWLGVMMAVLGVGMMVCR